MPRPISVIIHTAALRHNLARARRSAPDAKVLAVVKANAYGHGIERVYQGLCSCDGFALLDLDEAQRLRSLGWCGPILLLEGVFEPCDLELCSSLNLWHVVHCSEQIDWLSRHQTQTPHGVFLKMNSGMNRLGFAPSRFRAAWSQLHALPQVGQIVLMTHLSDADGARGIDHQMRIFDEMTADLPGLRTVSNSAAILRHPPSAINQPLASDWVRAGIMLYGSAPDYPQHSSADWQLEPSMTLASKIIALQSVCPGDSIGYGSQFVATEPTVVGIVACGYADGYPRTCPSGTPVLVAGVRSQTLGRVSMDMVAVDLSAVMLNSAGGEKIGIGSEVTLWGRAGNGAVLAIDEVARAGGTLGHELMCKLAARVPIQVRD